MDQSREQSGQPDTGGIPRFENEQIESFSSLELDYQNRAGQNELRQHLRNIQASNNRQLSEGIPVLPVEPQGKFSNQLLLLQFGYDIFSRLTPPQGLASGRVPDRYILGIGDELVVSFVGSTDRTVTIKVDREGQVILPDLQPIAAAGRRFDEFRADLVRRVQNALLGTEVFVSIGSVRLMAVYVLGEVERPGLYLIPSLSGPLDALAMAGGVKKTGSLRNIRIEGEDERQNFDLYALLAAGEGVDADIADGTRIVVPPIGPTIAVHGPVVRPGIYELKAGEEQVTQSQLLNWSGRPLRPRGNNFLINRIEDDGSQILVAADQTDSMLQSGDILLVNSRNNLRLGEVSISGHVRVPGSRSLESFPTLAALLDGGNLVDQRPYLLMAVLERSDPVTRARILKPVNLEKILAGAEDIILQNQDHLYILSAGDLEFLSEPALRNTILTGSAQENACPALKNLASSLSSIRSDRFAAVLRSVFVTADDADNDNGGNSDITPIPTLGTSEILTRSDLQQTAKEGIICPEIFNEQSDLLPFVLEYTVSLTGAVRRPGAYPVADETSLNSLIASSGGVSNSADVSNIEILTYSGLRGERAASIGRRYVDISTISPQQVQVASGSSVRFNSLLTDQESGSILLTGELVRPGVYSVTKGEKLSQLIERAGGLTDQAYPYGAVFTRVSVKLEQQESFKRTARELNNALILASMKKEVSADAIAAARGLAADFAAVEAPGRIVVEADPLVLDSRSDLDTVLQGGDALQMPKRPNYILVAGDVLNPGAQQFTPKKRVKDYIVESGGFSSSADKKRVFVVYPNGVAEPVTFSAWSRSLSKIPPGSTVIVPKDVNPFRTLELVREVTGIVAQLALSAASIAVISDNR